MKTRISKHGKYEIREGVANEVGDSLEPGDILIVRHDGMPVRTRVVKRITNMGELEESCRGMSEEISAMFRLMGLAYPGFFDMHPYLVRVGDGDDYLIWTAEDSDDSPVKIKHPLVSDEPIVADKVEVGAIAVDKVLVDGTASDGPDVRVPTEPGLYRDRIDDYVLFHRVCGSEKLHYTNLTCGERLNNRPGAYEVEDEYNFLQNYAPYTRITSIEQLRKALNAEVAE